MQELDYEKSNRAFDAWYFVSKIMRYDIEEAVHSRQRWKGSKHLEINCVLRRCV